MTGPKVIGNIDLPEYKPELFECTCCGKSYSKYNFVGLSWGNYTCIKCEIARDEAIVEQMNVKKDFRDMIEVF